MKLEYIELLSPEPIKLQGIGYVRSPTLRSIADITPANYRFYLSLLLMTPEAFYERQGMAGSYEKLTPEEKSEIHIYDLIINDPSLIPFYEMALSFFFTESVVFDDNEKVFLTCHPKAGEEEAPLPAGVIHKAVWNDLCDIISQLNFIEHTEEEYSNVKSKKALKILEKLKAGRKKKKTDSYDPDTDLGNIISAVAAKSSSLNMINIWDITIYQLWDTFHRLKVQAIYDIEKTSVSVWGDKEKQFDQNVWYKNIKN